MESGTVLNEAQGYKQRQEAFVTGLTGGSVLEIYLVTLVSVTVYVAWAVVQTRTGLFTSSHRWSISSLFLDFALNWLGLLASVTLYASAPVTLNALILAPVALLAAGSRARSAVLKSSKSAKQSTKKEKPEAATTSSYLPRQVFLTIYRAGMMIITCIAILAVDFPLFPRRFAKVETWGTSLMDLGVGSFVFSMGLVSSRATLLDSFLGRTTTPVRSVLRAVRAAIPVLALGLIRLAAIKFLDYQEHETEYGVHWNFFMTLGCLPPLVALVGFVPKRIPTSVISLAIAVVYEILLDKTDLGAYVLTAPRTNLLAQNREGVFSFFGYLSIFLAGKSTGFYVLPSAVSLRAFFFPLTRAEYEKVLPSAGKLSSRLRLVALLSASSALNGLLLHFLSYKLSPSRRLANLPYVLWVTSYNTAYLALFVVVEAICLPTGISYENAVPLSVEAINSNGLAIFLLANVLTGVVNMSVRTLDQSPESSLLILIGYLAVICAVSVGLYSRRIFIKF